jgi:hypothetical protein
LHELHTFAELLLFIAAESFHVFAVRDAPPAPILGIAALHRVEKYLGRDIADAWADPERMLRAIHLREYLTWYAKWANGEIERP